MPGLGGPYETKAEILSFLQKLDPDIVLADITDTIYNAASELINTKTSTHWEVFTGDVYIDGNGRNSIISPIVPIVSLTSLVIINTDTTEESLDVSGSDRQVWFNDQTGVIQRINNEAADITRNLDNGSIFPTGLKNIKLTGTFGRDGENSDVYNILKLLHTLIVTKMMSLNFPNLRKTNLIHERIGEYEYRIGDMMYSKDPKNVVLSLDGYINMLLDSLPKDDQFGLEAV